MTVWQGLGKRDPPALVDARLQLHWAAQPIAAAGADFGHHMDDDSHTNMEWLGAKRLLAGQVTATQPPFRVAFHLSNLTLMLLDLEGDEIGRLALEGLELEQGYEWLSAMIATLIEVEDVHLARPTHPLPQHAVQTGGRFSLGDGADLAEVERWFGNADMVLRSVREEEPEASPVRCWPHHFDIATLIAVEADASKTIGIGMTPGDDNYAEPYWYVTPWPYPDADDLPKLDVGSWHTEGWIGAVLTGSAVVAAGDADAQHDRSTAFVKSAVRRCRELLTD